MNAENSTDVRAAAPKTIQAFMDINTFANRCGYFFNAYLTPVVSADGTFYPGKQPSPNNGYNCRHPECKRVEEGIGCCHTWTCPLGYEAGEEDCAAFGLEYEESEFIIVDILEGDFNEKRMRRRIDNGENSV